MMQPKMRLQKFNCPSCGAPRETLQDALVLLCGYCGAFVAFETGHLYRGTKLADLRDSQIRSWIRPSKADARKIVLTSRMSDAAARGDRITWRACAEEFYALWMMTDPQSIPAGRDDPRHLRDWHREAVAVGEFYAFCPDAQRAQGEAFTKFDLLGADGDPVQVARRLLDAVRDAFREMTSHPDYPSGAVTPDSEAYAKQLIRNQVAGLASLLGPGVTERILTEVLGDRRISSVETLSCEGCGAPLPVPGTGDDPLKCPHCGAVVRVDRDPWMEATLALWETSWRDLARRGSTRGREVVIHALGVSMGPLWKGGRLTAEAGFAFLRRAIPWIARDVVQEGIRTYAMAFESDPPKKTYLSGLLALAGSWEPTQAAPPAVPALDAEGGAESPFLGEDDPWVLQSAAQWGHVRGGGGTESMETRLLGMCLTPFHMGGSITIDQALAFFQKAEPAYDRDRMREAASTFLLGFESHPAIGDFLRALIRQERG
ncbi:MAG: TFIIB-type zinc ribbon-containing protein [Planctomycetota bacterium]|jgi:DNA-directed RNA polymerase subunit RPC12/RpoP